MHEDKDIHQHLIDLGNKVEQIEDKLDAALRMLWRIGKRLADDGIDKEKASVLASELAAAASQLESTVVAAKQPV